MPRLSAKQRELRRLSSILKQRASAALTRELLSDEDSDEAELDEYWAVEYERVQSTRYTSRPLHYRRRKDSWRKLLYNHEHTNDDEFLKNFRLRRSEFFRLVKLVKSDPAFLTAGKRPFRGGAELHLMALLKFLGSYGNGNSALDIGKFLSIARGSVHNYINRAISAVLKLEASTITWPDVDERRVIAQRIKQKYGFVNCVGITDGTLFPLATKPRCNGEDYFSRKSSYSVNALVTCDDVARVRNLVVGWPGSTHDNRVWANSPMALHPENHFQCNEYLLGDSAFQASSIMVPAFKKPPKAELHPDNTYFNSELAEVRIRSEHCIGLLKMRFQYLREVRVVLGKKRRHMRRLIRYVTCACIIHNLLIAEPIPSKWQKELEKFITRRLDDDDELNVAVPAGADGAERRNQLLAYMLEIRSQR